MASDASNELVTIKEIARFLNIAEKTIYKMAAAGRIPAYKIGGVWRFRLPEVAEWLENQHNQCRRRHAVC